MGIVNFVGNAVDSVGQVFTGFFDFFILYIGIPIVLIIGLVIFFGIQYLLFKLYAFMFRKITELIQNRNIILQSAKDRFAAKEEENK